MLHGGARATEVRHTHMYRDRWREVPAERAGKISPDRRMSLPQLFPPSPVFPLPLVEVSYALLELTLARARERHFLRSRGVRPGRVANGAPSGGEHRAAVRQPRSLSHGDLDPGPRGAALLRPGDASRLRIQPRPGHSRARRSRAAPSRLPLLPLRTGD